MKKHIKKIASSLAVIGVMLGSMFALAQPAMAAVDCKTTPEAAVCKVQGGVNDVGGSNNTTTLPGFITLIINTLLFIIGSVAVIMIIIGGIRYVTSNGEQSHVKAAKDTILYAVVGLIVAILAYAIVNFVVANIK